ncbi:alcohol dehydrogenase, partial [Klebsiella pneumoniae]|nr:alcohol dehydrogenase [Klebsiella pneumoniae]
MIPTFVVWSQSMFNDAIVYDRYGPPAAVLTLKRLPLAPLAGGRVRVRTRFAPVNPSVLSTASGVYCHCNRPAAGAGYEGRGVGVAAPSGG